MAVGDVDADGDQDIVSVHWVSGGKDFTVVETECKAKGDQDCVFQVFKEPLN